MPQFVYPTPQANPYASSISDLMLRQGDIQAQRALELARIHAGEITSVAGDVAAIPGQIQKSNEQQLQQQLGQQAVESGGIDLETKKLTLARMKAISAAWATPGGIDKVLEALPPDVRVGIQKELDAGAKAHSDAQEAAEKASTAMADAFGRSAASVRQGGNDPIVAQGVISDLQRQYASNPQALQTLKGIEQQIQANPTPAFIKTLTDRLIAASPKQRELDAQEMTARARMKATEPKPGSDDAIRAQLIQEAQGQLQGAAPTQPVVPPPEPIQGAPPSPNPAPSFQPSSVTMTNNLPPASGQPVPVKTQGQIGLDVVRQLADAKKEGPIPQPGSEADTVARARRLAVAANGGQPLTDAQIEGVDAKAMQHFKETNTDPEVRAAALAQKNMAVALQKIQEAQQPTKDDAATVADDLVNHRQSPSQVKLLFGTRGAAGQAFMLHVASEAKRIDPSFNFEQAESEYQLSKSSGFQNTVRYMDSALESIPRLEKNVQNLGNGSFRTLNQVANAARGQFNSTDLKRFKTDALLVGDEIAKVLSGGGTGSATSDAKLKQATDIIGASDSVPAIAAAMEEVQALMGNRRRALTRGTYMEGLGATPPPSSTPASSGPPAGVQGLLGR